MPKILAKVFNHKPQLPNYLCNWSEKHKFVYVETPKVACTTIKRVLQRAEANGDSTKVPANVHERVNSPLKRVSDDPEAFESLFYRKDTFIFCFVRNPFTRALSCYLDKMVVNEWERNRLAPTLNLSTDTAPSFKDFLVAISKQSDEERDIHWSTQTFLLRPNRLEYSFIGRFETFHSQFEAVCKYLDISEFADLRQTAHATNADEKRNKYFGPEEIQLIQEIYLDDFRNFGYGFLPAVL